ncbi:JNK-interacting protein syd isoform X2 [Dermatophagoides pteronyssinus]|uniref:JNK-interacting protein syd isoform X2 n=1 Tax=Dermatophagoides pteronyssinus TaxID=6956 RepID=UPI003F666439
MDIILQDQDSKSKMKSNNNYNNSDMNLLNNNNNNNSIKGIKDTTKMAKESSNKDDINHPNTNNNNTTDLQVQSSTSSANNSPLFGTPITITNETIYEFGSHFENPSHVISEKVQNLASQIYNELQKILTRYNDDEEAVNGLMPLIVNVLESLDLALIENQQLQVDLELCKDDNEQLVQAFEKEKQHKKKIEQRLFEYEFSTEEEKQHYQQHIDSLANIVKMLELKAKNSSDHSSRLEEKESEMKKEYSKLHERYNELRRSHFDLMERVKIILGTDMDNKDLSSKEPPNFSNLANIFRTNLQKFASNEDNMENYDLSGMSTTNARVDDDDVGHSFIHQSSNSFVTSDGASNRQDRWMETEMSYDDTTTIIEDVEELQKDNSKDKNRDQSLSGKFVHPSEYSTNENFFGMEKEIENLITENNELMATKNALNIVKDDLIVKVDELQSDLAMCNNEIQQREAVQERLKSRISQLEEELKKNKEELDDCKQKLTALKEDEEEGVPMAQRKRFTRVEMSRVLMERNSYKEKYFELQEALKWAELSRASRSEDKRSNFWKFFSNLFNPSPTTGTIDQTRTSVPGSATLPAGTPAIRYSVNPTTTIPALEAMRRRARVQQNGDLELMMDSDLSSERARAMKNLKAHVSLSGNGDRIQAYGWSITGASSSSSSSPSSDPTNKSSFSLKNTSVPVPIYCRPLGGEDIGMKIWCATAVDLSGGEAGFPDTSNVTNKLDYENCKSNQDPLTDLENEIGEAIKEQTLPTDQQYSNFVWICSVSHSKSKVTIVNIRSNPGEVLDSFFIKTHLLCICSIPGAKNSDFLGDHGVSIQSDEQPELFLSYRKEKPLNDVATSITFSSPVPSIQSDVSTNFDNNSITNDDEAIKAEEASSVNSMPILSTSNEQTTEAKNVTLEKLTDYVAYTQPPSPTNSMNGCDDDSDQRSHNQQKSNLSSSPQAETNTMRSSSSSLPIQPMSTRLPTMWLGGQNGVLYVHSAITQWSHCIATVHLSDSILHIVHYRGRVFVALANGQCCIFYRCEQTGEWNFNQYYTLDIGIYSTSMNNQQSSSETNNNNKQPQTALYSIRCLEIVKDVVWLGYRNLIFIVNTRTFKVINFFIAHPRKETYVRHLAVMGDGVWCSFRLDSTLRLYSALKPYQHLQTIDIEPYVTKMVMSKSFNFVRITALKASNHRLWIGTSNGVVLCLPCATTAARKSDDNNTMAALSKKIQTTEATGSLTISSFIPLCDVATIQLSFHGHKDNIKFFVCTNNLILSGGEGYIDFRINNSNDVSCSLSKGDRSHLIVWEINA